MTATDFLEAFDKQGAARRKAIQDMVVGLVGIVSSKMKGFSRQETVAYYKEITNRAWKQVEAAQTPEVKSAKFDEVMEWTMLDRKYDDRTRETFGSGPVTVPTWWWRFDPRLPRPVATPISGGRPIATAGGAPSAGPVSLPTLPGATFAASLVNGVQGFAGSVVGNLTDFTRGVTNRTNPIPVTTSSNRSTWKGGGGGSSGGRSCACACACACAGCACACAGGGR